MFSWHVKNLSWPGKPEIIEGVTLLLTEGGTMFLSVRLLFAPNTESMKAYLYLVHNYTCQVKRLATKRKVLMEVWHQRLPLSRKHLASEEQLGLIPICFLFSCIKIRILLHSFFPYSNPLICRTFQCFHGDSFVAVHRDVENQGALAGCFGVWLWHIGMCERHTLT